MEEEEEGRFSFLAMMNRDNVVGGLGSQYETTLSVGSKKLSPRLPFCGVPAMGGISPLECGSDKMVIG